MSIRGQRGDEQLDLASPPDEREIECIEHCRFIERGH